MERQYMGALRGALFLAFQTMKSTALSSIDSFVRWSFSVKALEDYIQTIESLMADKPEAKNSLFNLYCELIVARKKHQEQNVVTEAPTAEDFQDYVVHYADSVREGTV